MSTTDFLQLKNRTHTALANNLNQDRAVLGIFAIPRGERLEELKTVALGVNLNLNVGSVGRRGLEGVLASIISTGRKFVACGGRELEGLARGSRNGISERVEAEGSSEGHGSDNIRGSDESMGSGVSIVTASEVTVVRGND
jgi:hypothetical protein